MGLTVAFVFFSGFYFLTTGVRDTKRLEQTLNDRFDWAEKYTPASDGSIAAGRIEAFIRVRKALQPNCADYQVVMAGISGLDDLESEDGKVPGDAASTGLLGLKSVFRAGPEMIEFTRTRNMALLEEDMGLGEYLYIYLTTYGAQLAAESDSDFAKMEEAYISERTRKEYAQILTNQLAALEKSGLQSSLANLDTDLQAEIQALNDGSHTSPWPQGPVGRSRESLAPFQQQLDGLYCSGIARTELLQKNHGLQFDG